MWNDQDEALRITQRVATIKKELDQWEQLTSDVNDLIAIASIEEEDQTVNLRSEIEKRYQDLLEQFEKVEYMMMFCGSYDRNDAVVALHAGTGGTDAQDWTEILLRMYLRYAEKKGFRTEIISINCGNEAGIKKVVFEVQGRNAYGYFKSEAGVHRLVRISPFDAEAMRHTSFALVEILPDLGELEDIKIKPEDLKIEVFRASGHGGQSVNTTDSAVRVTHIPTGLVNICMNERSQYQNKRRAIRHLKNKLHAYYELEKEEEKKKLRGEFSSIAWGNQIRSYVIHPYKMVKDHRTNYETSDVESVLNGDISAFIEAYMKMKVEERAGK